MKDKIKRARLIYNPTSGQEIIKKNIAEVLDVLEDVGYETSAYQTTPAPLSAQKEAERAAKAASHATPASLADQPSPWRPSMTCSRHNSFVAPALTASTGSASPRASSPALSLSSSTSFWALLLPIPGTRHRARRSPARIARFRSPGDSTEQMARASLGLTPDALCTSSKAINNLLLYKLFSTNRHLAPLNSQYATSTLH